MPPSAFRPATLLRELKRRRVFRVAGAYLVVGFVVLQVADLVVEPLGLPAWTMRLIIVLAAAGLPIVLALGWVFDITPDGVVTTGAATTNAAEPGTPRAPPSHENVSREGVPRLRAVLVVALAAVFAGAVGFMSFRGGTAAALDTDRVIVDAFANRTGDPALDPLGTMAADWIVQGIQTSLDVVIVPAGVGLEMARQAAVRGGVTDARGRLDRLAQTSGAATVVTGAYYLEGDSVRFSAEVTDARQGRLMRAATPVRVSRDDPTAGLDRLRGELVSFLGLHGLWGGSEVETTALATSRPPGMVAYGHYTAGVELFLRHDMAGAAAYLDRAVALDSGFIPAIVYAAAARMNQGDYATAEPLVRLARRQRERINPFDRATVDFIDAWWRGDLQAESAAACRAVDIAPAVDFLYVCATQMLQMNRPAAAIDMIARVPRAYIEQDEWRGWWRVHVNALHLLGEHRDELAIIRDGLPRHPDYGPLVAGELEALAARGRPRQVLERLDRVFALWQSEPERVLHVALELERHGHDAAATEVYRGIADLPPDTVPATRLVRARALAALRRFDDAAAILEDLRTSAPAESALPADPEVLGRAGVVAVHSGSVAGARAILDQLVLMRGPRTGGRQYYNAALVATALGDPDHAVSLLREAIADGYTYSKELHHERGFRALRGVRAFDELVRP